MHDNTIRYLFDRIPALGELRGIAKLDAEEIIGNAIEDAIEEYLAGCDPAVVADAIEAGE